MCLMALASQAYGQGNKSAGIDKSKKSGADLQVLSIKVSDVVLAYSLDGTVSKKWNVQVFVKNSGLKPLRQIPVSLTAWHGKQASLQQKKRLIAGKGVSSFLKKNIPALTSGKSKKVNFTIITSKSVSKLLIGAWVNSGKITADLVVKDVSTGKVAGTISDEKNRANNYKEKLVVY